MRWPPRKAIRCQQIVVYCRDGGGRYPNEIKHGHEIDLEEGATNPQVKEGVHIIVISASQHFFAWDKNSWVRGLCYMKTKQDISYAVTTLVGEVTYQHYILQHSPAQFTLHPAVAMINSLQVVSESQPKLW